MKNKIYKTTILVLKSFCIYSQYFTNKIEWNNPQVDQEKQFNMGV